MKKFLAVFMVVMFWVYSMWAVPHVQTAFADSGQSVGNKTFTLINSSTVYTNVTTSAVAVFDNPMVHFSCDVINTGATTTATFALYGNAGSSYTAFGATYGLLQSAVTLTANSLATFTVAEKPARVIKAVIVNSGQTNVFTVNCAGVQ
jgi:hypothetical protein